MKPRFTIPAFCALSVLALCSDAQGPRWYEQPGTPVTVEWSGFELRARLPQGWSLTTDHGFAPPPELASSCGVRGVFHTGRNWDDFLASSLGAREGGDRYVLKIGGHPAVSDRYEREARTIRNIYIDLSALQSDSGSVWTLERSRTRAGSDCEQQFVAMIESAKIRRTTAPAP